MDRSVAATLLRHELEPYAHRSRAELMQRIDRVDAYEVIGPDGVGYQVEVSVHWDAEPGGVLRVVASIDDGGFRSALRPVVDGFLVDEEGTVEMPDLDGDAPSR